MNVDVLAEWAEKHSRLLDSRKAIGAAGSKASQVDAKLGWPQKFAPPIRRWREMLALIEATECLCATRGHPPEAGDRTAAVLPQAGATGTGSAASSGSANRRHGPHSVSDSPELTVVLRLPPRTLYSRETLG